MDPFLDPELESQIHEALRRLPDPAAPRSLHLKVRAALDARERRPWWQRAWGEWPALARAALVLLALATAAMASRGAFWLSDSIQPYADQARSHATEFTSQVQSWLEQIATYVPVPETDWLSLLPYGVAVLVVSYLMCLGLGTGIVRLVQGHRLFRL